MNRHPSVPVVGRPTRSLALLVACAVVVTLFLGRGELNAQSAGLCLDLQDLGAWTPRGTPDALFRPPPEDDDNYHSFPARVQLGSEAVFSGQFFQLILPPNSQQTPHPLRLWRTSGDTLVLHLGTGMYGVEAGVHRDTTGWRGTLRTFTDVFPVVTYERSIALMESSSDTPPRIAASEDPPLPRSVELVGGAVLVLGERMPKGVSVEPRVSGAVTVLATVSGRFARPDTVIVALTPKTGRIQTIDLRYRSATDLEPVEAALAAEYGPATPGPTGSSSSRWGNRTTSVSVIGRGGQGRARVVLSDPRIDGMEP